LAQAMSTENAQVRLGFRVLCWHVAVEVRQQCGLQLEGATADNEHEHCLCDRSPP